MNFRIPPPSIAVVIALIAATAPAAEAAETEPLGPVAAIDFRQTLSLSETDRTIAGRFIGHAVTFANELTAEKVRASCRESPESFAWVDFRYLDGLNLAFELTGDTGYLDLLRDKFQLYRDIMTTGPDEYLGWYGRPIPARRSEKHPD